jgi:probable F420-dependent oxidoreductase
MHIGLSRPPTPPDGLPDVDGAVVARIAERLGFESIFYGEHPVTPIGDPGNSVHSAGVPFFQDTLVMLARASSVTSRIKIGSGVFLIPLHQPVMFAKQLASLDFYSGGRLIVGAGAGWSRVECEVMGGNFDRRWAQAREAIQLMKRLWTEDVTAFHGEFFDVAPIRLEPKPLTKPWPPVLLAPPVDDSEPFDGPRALRAFKRIVSYGDGWFPARMGVQQIRNGAPVMAAGRKVLNRLCEEAGRNPAELQITLLIRAEIHDGDLEWPELVTREELRRYEDVGVDRVAVTIPTITSEAHAEEVLARVADSVL